MQFAAIRPIRPILLRILPLAEAATATRNETQSNSVIAANEVNCSYTLINRRSCARLHS